MAEVVKEIPRSGARTRGGSKYEKYFDGQLWKLTQGVDCPQTVNTACASIGKAAKKRGLVVKITRRKAENAIYVQAKLSETQQ